MVKRILSRHSIAADDRKLSIWIINNLFHNHNYFQMRIIKPNEDIPMKNLL